MRSCKSLLKWIRNQTFRVQPHFDKEIFNSIARQKKGRLRFIETHFIQNMAILTLKMEYYVFPHQLKMVQMISII